MAPCPCARRSTQPDPHPPRLRLRGHQRYWVARSRGGRSFCAASSIWSWHLHSVFLVFLAGSRTETMRARGPRAAAAARAVQGRQARPAQRWGWRRRGGGETLVPRAATVQVRGGLPTRGGCGLLQGGCWVLMKAPGSIWSSWTPATLTIPSRTGSTGGGSTSSCLPAWRDDPVEYSAQAACWGKNSQEWEKVMRSVKMRSETASNKHRQSQMQQGAGPFTVVYKGTRLKSLVMETRSFLFEMSQIPHCRNHASARGPGRVATTWVGPWRHVACHWSQTAAPKGVLADGACQLPQTGI